VTSVTSPVTARRVAPTSAFRRASEIVLVGGTVIAVVAAFGPVWAVRTGLVVAVVAAVVACVFAWRELFSARREHARAMLTASRDHGQALSDERERNGAVVATLGSRIRDAGAVIERQRVTIAELRVQISGLKGDKAYLRAEVDHREGVISSLRDTVRAREAELIALQADDGDDADVHEWPRRVLAEHESAWDELPAADDLWTDGSHPTVVDLKMLDLAMILPNYEEDRRVG
jgi:hypothetical protein